MKAFIFFLTLNIPQESRCVPDSFFQKDIEVKNELMESDSSHAMTLWSLNTVTYVHQGLEQTGFTDLSVFCKYLNKSDKASHTQLFFGKWKKLFFLNDCQS